jgi:hypothetical protein
MQVQYAIFKEGQPIFVGNEQVVRRAFHCLYDCFYFTAGTSKQRTDKFPYTLSEI